MLEALITREGEVACVNVLRGLPFGLDDAAADTVRSWRFEPATIDGEPVDVHYYLTLRFRLER